MFETLRSYLVPNKPVLPTLTDEKREEQEQASAAIREKVTALHKSAKEFEATAKEFLEDKDQFEGQRRGKY